CGGSCGSSGAAPDRKVQPKVASAAVNGDAARRRLPALYRGCMGNPRVFKRLPAARPVSAAPLQPASPTAWGKLANKTNGRLPSGQGHVRRLQAILGFGLKVRA